MIGLADLPPMFGLLWGEEATAPADWTEIDRIAGQHRLRPLLHERAGAGRWSLPPEIAAGWSAAHRRSALRALRQRGELARLGKLLGAAGMDAVVLKGGAFVWRGWIDPALRPLRDLDLLLAPDAALEAHALLRGHGFEQIESVGEGKHLPGLIAPGSEVLIELHTRLFDTPTTTDGEREAAFRAEALTSAAAAGAIGALADTDTLLHVILHGVLDHQLNTGPLLLFDLALLIRHGAVDWARFWRLAEVAGGVRAAQLALALAAVVDPGLAIGWHGHEPADLTPDTLRAAAELMLIDTARRSELGLAGRIARLERGAWLGETLAALRRGATSPAGLWRRLAGTGSAALHGADRRHVGRSLAVARWLRET